MENIFLTKDDVPDFKEYLKDPSLKLLSERKDNDCVIRTYDSDQTFHIPNELLKLIESEYSNPIIFGKDTTENIVSVEVENGQLHLFKEYAHGIEVETRPYKYWFITPKKVSSRQIPLSGNQYYKYIAYFDNEEEFGEAKKVSYRHDMWTIWDNKEAAMVHEGITYFKGMKVQDVSVLSFDIETSGLARNKSSYIFCISNTYRKNGKVEKKLFREDEYESQGEMLKDWCQWICDKDPSIILNHNIYGFDLDYIWHVAEMEGIDLILGRDGSPLVRDRRESQKRKDGSQSYSYHNMNIFGREIVDTLFAAINYSPARKDGPYESLGLKQIIKEEKLEKENRQFYDASKIKDNWGNPEEREKILAYVSDDSDDALALYDLMIASTFYFNQSVSKTFQAMVNSSTGAQLNNMMVRNYLQDGHSIAKKTELTEKVEGGISFGVPGVYRHIIKIDLKSCYPSQVLRFKLYDKEKDPKSYFYQMMHFFTYQRFDLKNLYIQTRDKYYSDREQSSKTFINSGYGLLNTPGLNYNSPKIAAKITFESRQVINLALLWASGKDVKYWMDLFKLKTGKTEEDETDEDLNESEG